MKRTYKSICASVLTVTLVLSSIPISVFAETGYMGYFGGITEGRRLPKTSETILDTRSETQNGTLSYKEYVIMDKTPTLFEGEMEIENGAPQSLDELEDSGTYEVTLGMHPGDDSTSEATIDRDITFEVNYYKSGNSVIKDYTVTSWEETLTSPTGSYTLNEDKSYYDISIVESYSPGVMYYKGDISSKAYYDGGLSEDGIAEVTRTGGIYGYDSAWSSTETQRIDAYVKNGEDTFNYQVRPSVSVYKDLQYGDNEPTYTSFDGNYKEVLINESGLFYNILDKSNSMYLTEDSGSASIDSRNYFEQLPPVNLTNLKGAPYYSDIEKLYGMGIIDGNPNLFVPTQAITRGEFVTMLVKAFKLPTDKYEAASTKSTTKPMASYYADVLSNRDDFKYIMTARDYGVAYGATDGHFYPDSQITRQEAICMIIRSLGLQTIGITGNPQSPFIDDEDIASWAKNDLYTAYKVGIISTGDDFKIYPKKTLTKAEAAVMINSMIDYLRYTLKENYAESIVNYIEN